MISVLVVDDERDVREVVAEVLEEEGYEVLGARDGAEGLVQLRAHHPALVLLDLMMPGMNGWEFCAARSREPELRAIPIVVISALGRVSGLDVAAFLQKPFDLKALVSAVRRYGGHPGDVGAHA
jgi:CheY-like chemotaxis protein